MGVFPFSFKSTLSWNITKFPKPWDTELPAIYSFIKDNIKLGKSSLLEEEKLPDDEDFFKGEKYRWVSGGLDGTFGHHVGKKEQMETAKAIYTALEQSVNKPTKKNIAAFYKLLLDNNALDFIDQLLSMVSNSRSFDSERLQQFARWLAENSPNRSPVKFAIAILGIFPNIRNKELFITLGMHDEFTLWSVVALRNTLQNPEPELWNLAKNVNGWGKIHIVERLSKTQNTEIKYWMLRDGYKNSIMYEYLAYICATTGELRRALEHPEPDDALLLGAGDIIEALINGGPSEDIDNYEDGANVMQLYISHIVDRNLSFEQLLTVKTIRDFIQNDNENWLERKERGWTDSVRKEIAEKTSAILSKPELKQRIILALEDEISSEKYSPFHTIALVAETLSIDTWDYYYKRQKSGHGNEWYYLMKTKSEDKIDKAIALAEQMIPLNEISIGPKQEIGIGSEFKNHDALSFIVQALGDFPKKGWNLVKTSLASPVIRNRNMSLKTLSKWGKDNWPEDAEFILQEALKIEPDDNVQKTMQKIINGELID